MLSDNSTAGEIKSWADEALELMRTKGGEGLLVWRQPRLVGLRGKKRKAMNSLPRYFGSHVGLTDYPSYRENDWQIGSGMLESTAKQLVGIRLKGSGMHWSPAAASAITALRAYNINWHNLWKNLVL
jgi:hypothetical protein